MEIVDADRLVDGPKAEVVGRAVGLPPLDAAAGEPHREAVVVVIAPRLRLAVAAELHRRRPAELTAEQNERLVEHPALGEIRQERRHRLIDLPGEGAVVRLDLFVVVPRLAGPVPELHVAHAALEEPAGDERLPAVDGVAVERPHRRRLARQIEGLGGLHLHPEGHLKGVDAGIEPSIAAGLAVGGIELLEPVELMPLHGSARMWAANVLDELLDFGVLRVDRRPLERAGEKARLPVVGPLHRMAAGTHRHEPGKILIFRPQAVEDPAPDARPRLDGVAAIHEHQARLMVGHLSMHRADHRQPIGVAGELREDVADLEAALAMAGKAEGGRQRRSGLPFGRKADRGGLVGIFRQRRLGIEGVDLRRAAVQKNMDDALGPRGEVGGLHCQRLKERIAAGLNRP